MSSSKGRVGVIGATSIVGDYLLPLLVQDGYDVVAFSRQSKKIENTRENHPISWQWLTRPPFSAIGDVPSEDNAIAFWINLAPVWVLPEYFAMFLAYGARHIVTVSSTSKFTKSASDDPVEQKLANRLAANEEHFITWVTKKNIRYTVLSSSMVYDPGRDKNISIIASFIRRFSFFCVFGEARGLRQPVHAQDVASACLQCLSAGAAVNRCYTISGGEILTYREMVGRIFLALGKPPRCVQLPLWFFRMTIIGLRLFPPFRHWSFAMASRMNQDMVFDHFEATRDLNFSPRKFQLNKNDLLKK